MNQLVDNFTSIYSNLDKTNIATIEQVYEPHVVFIDPFNEIHGIEKLKNYFSNLYQNVETCEFKIEDVFMNGKAASLYWTMNLAHKKLNNGMPIKIPGSTLIRFKDKVTYHQDYFDAGALIYEQVPLLGLLIKRIKQTL